MAVTFYWSDVRFWRQMQRRSVKLLVLLRPVSKSGRQVSDCISSQSVSGRPGEIASRPTSPNPPFGFRQTGTLVLEAVDESIIICCLLPQPVRTPATIAKSERYQSYRTPAMPSDSPMDLNATPSARRRRGRTPISESKDHHCRTPCPSSSRSHS